MSIATHYGHEISTPEDADILCLSVCDITEVEWVKKIREKFPRKIIATGGHACVYYRIFKLYSDFVNIGHGFDFFSCQTIEEIRTLPCVVSDFSSPPYKASEKVEWRVFPIANVTKRQKYYIGAFGCKNKCQFCLTSWTHKHQINPYARQATQKYKNITLVSNDSHNTDNRMTQSIMVRDFISPQKTLKKYAVYRLGIEFATEHDRKKYGKPFTDDDFVTIFLKAQQYGVRLKLFCISGINTIDEWHHLFANIPYIYTKGKYEIKFTNLTFEMFTPLKKGRFEIDPAHYFDSTQVKQFVSYYKQRVWPLNSMPCSSPLKTMQRMAFCWSKTEQDILLAKKMKNLDEAVHALKSVYFLQDYNDDIQFDLSGKEECRF